VYRPPPTAQASCDHVPKFFFTVSGEMLTIKVTRLSSEAKKEAILH
jgi:hypothetical protein